MNADEIISRAGKCAQHAFNGTVINITKEALQALLTRIDDLQAQLTDKTALLDVTIAGQETLQKALSDSQARERAAVEDLKIVMPHWCCKNKSKDYCPVSTVTGMVDCSYCGDWEWRGPQAGEVKQDE